MEISARTLQWETKITTSMEKDSVSIDMLFQNSTAGKGEEEEGGEGREGREKRGRKRGQM